MNQSSIIDININILYSVQEAWIFVNPLVCFFFCILL